MSIPDTDLLRRQLEHAKTVVPALASWVKYAAEGGERGELPALPDLPDLIARPDATRLHQCSSGLLVQFMREYRGVSRNDLAEMSKVPYSTIANIENGQREPRMATMKAIADALGFRSEELFFGQRLLEWVMTA